MNLLLDTHTFIWWDGDPAKLSAAADHALRNPSNLLFLSVVSVWEIQIKHQLGRLHLRLPIEEIVKEQQERNGIQILSVELPHVLMTGELPLHHSDPFDRLLIAQAVTEKFTLVSKDAEITKYAVHLLW